MDNKEFGDKLKGIRELNNNTVRELAELFDIKDEEWQDIESGEDIISLDTLIKFTKHYDLNLYDIISELDRELALVVVWGYTPKKLYNHVIAKYDRVGVSEHIDSKLNYVDKMDRLLTMLGVQHSKAITLHDFNISSVNKT